MVEYFRCGSATPSDNMNTVFTIDECLALVREHEILRGRTGVVVVALGPSGSGKTTMIRRIMEDDVAAMLLEDNTSPTDISMSVYAWTPFSKNKMCDVIKNMALPIKSWAPLRIAEDENILAALEEVSFEDRQKVFDTMASTGTTINRQSTRFFSTIIIRRPINRTYHYYVDLPGWEPTDVEPSSVARSKSAEADAKGDVAISGLFIRRELANLPSILKASSERKSVTFATLLRSILAKSTIGMVVQCFSAASPTYQKVVRELGAHIRRAFQGQGVSASMLGRIGTPQPPTRSLPRVRLLYKLFYNYYKMKISCLFR